MSPKTQPDEELVGLILREQKLQIWEVRAAVQAGCCLGQSRALPRLHWASRHCRSQAGSHSRTVLGGLHVEDEVRAANPCGIFSEPLRSQQVGTVSRSQIRVPGAWQPPIPLEPGQQLSSSQDTLPPPPPPKKKLLLMKTWHQEGLGALPGQAVCPEASQCPNGGSSQAG